MDRSIWCFLPISKSSLNAGLFGAPLIIHHTNASYNPCLAPRTSPRHMPACFFMCEAILAVIGLTRHLVERAGWLLDVSQVGIS